MLKKDLKDGELNITGLPCKKGQRIEMILHLYREKKNNQKKNKFSAIKLKTLSFIFNRDEANER